MAEIRKPTTLQGPEPESEQLLTLHDFGALSRRSLNALTALAFVLLFSAAGIVLTHPGHAASVPEVKSGISGKCLQDRENAQQPSHFAELWSCNGSEQQQITIGGGRVTHGGYCMATVNGGLNNGTLVHFYPSCTSAQDQQWTYTNNTLVGVQSGKCLDDPGSSTSNGTTLQIYTCNGTNAQKWTAAQFVLPSPPPTPPPTTTPPTPPPTPPTHTPPPPPTHTPAPTPTPGGGGGGDGGGGGGGGGGGVQPGPSAPTGFQASVATDNAIVSLSWDALADPTSIASYQLDRSIDQATWSPLATNISGNKYADTTTDFGIHYYYRLRAVDAAGNSSDFAFTDASTPDFTSNATPGGGSVYHSQDNLVAVSMPSGAVASSADCSVASNSTEVHPSGNKKVAAGPYQLVCKDDTGGPISSFGQPLTWTFTLKTKLKGLTAPLPYSASTSGQLTAITGSAFNKSSGALSFKSQTADSVLVLATIVPGPPWNLIAFILFVLGILAAFAVFIIRRQRSVNYNDYLRQKYYNI